MLVIFRNITFAILSLSFTNLLSAEFEGKITMVKETCFDTLYYTYFISKNNVRIEESNARKTITGIYLVNMEKEEVFFIHPSKSIYTKLRKQVSAETNGNFEIRKTENYKLVNGVKCFQWRVRNKTKNTEFAYWVTQNDFEFFDKMVSVLNQHTLRWEFFNQIPNTKGFFPMLSEERTLVRDQKMRTAVLQIKRKTLDDTIFNIPSAYRKM